MNGGNFTKLFASIVTSTIWREADHVRVVWVTMLAICDRRGMVRASVPGLAGVANVTIEHCLEAIDRFLSPDPWSRTKEHDGRRIEVVAGGWRLLNYEEHRDGPAEAGDGVSMDPAAVRQRRKRARERLDDDGLDERDNERDNVTGSDGGVTPSASASPSASGEVSKSENSNRDSSHERAAGKVDAMLNRPGVKRLADFLAAHDFGRWRDTVEGHIRASRVPLAIIAELELWLTGELNRRKTDPETLGEALNAYIAATAGETGFKTNYFGGFVRGVHRGREKNDNNRRNTNEARSIVEEQRAAEERRQDEADQAMLNATPVARLEELRLLAEAKVEREMPGTRKKTPQMFATLVRDELIRLVREER